MNIFDEIKRNIGTYDLAQQVGVKLRKAGDKYVGLCPFHKEQTPSFTVYPDGGFKCFGCGTSGQDVTAFYAKFYNLKQIEAAKELMARAGIVAYDFKKSPINTGDVYKGLHIWRNQMLTTLIDMWRTSGRFLKLHANPEEDFENNDFIQTIGLRADIERFIDILVYSDNDTILKMME